MVFTFKRICMLDKFPHKSILKAMSASKMLDIVNELKLTGLVVDKDFSFAYTPSSSYYMYGLKSGTESHVTFSFSEGKKLTWFILKYS